MKTFIQSLLAIGAAVTISTAPAQEPVSTGNIVGMEPAKGTVTIRSDQTNGMITFFGADKANVFTADGQPYILQNIKLGTKVTIQYAARADHWYISKIILPAGMVGAEAPSPSKAPMPAAPTQSNANGPAGPTTTPIQAPGRGAIVNVEPPTTEAGRDMRSGDITKQANPQQPRTVPATIRR